MRGFKRKLKARFTHFSIFLAFPAVLAISLTASCNSSDNSDKIGPPQSLESTILRRPPPPGGFDESGEKASGGDYSRDCLWQVTEDMNFANVFYLEQYANYWIAVLPIPQGGGIKLSGEFPYGRNISFNLYTMTYKPVDVLGDSEILPDAGSTNPFVAGNNRQASARNYTAWVRSAADAQGDDLNTLYARFPVSGTAPAVEEMLPLPSGIELPPNVVVLIYRVYLPDTGTDRAGGVDLPRITLVGADGSETSALAECGKLEPFMAPAINDFLARAEVGPLQLGFNAPPSTGSLQPLKWFKYFDMANTYRNHMAATALYPYFSDMAALDFARNMNNDYLMAYASQAHGSLVSLQAKRPATPSTVRGDVIADSTPIRYFSFCSNDFYSRRVFDCVYDEEIPKLNNQAFVLMGREADRPVNAQFECGVAWLNWGPFEESMLIYRQMKIDKSRYFPEGIAAIPQPAGQHEESVMKDYYPRPRYWNKADFEGLGCPITF
jgi:hypothetical protein